MKKTLQLSLLFSFLCLTLNIGYAVHPKVLPLQEKDGMELVKDQLSIDDFLQKDRRQIEEQLGKVLSFKEKIALKVMKRSIKRAIRKGQSKEDVKKAVERGDYDFYIVPFLAGFLLGLIGVLLVYLLMDEDNMRSAWIGLIATVVIPLIFLIFSLPFYE